MHVVDLELALRPLGAAAPPVADSADLSTIGYRVSAMFAADARLAQPGSQADAVLATNAPVALDPAALLLLTLDPAAYGRALTAHIFPEGSPLRNAWRSARALADGAGLPLRLRLRIPAAASDLHILRWETLRDPLTDLPLACDARLRLVRSLDSPDTRPITLGPKPALRALLVVANPRDLSAYGLAEIDVEGAVGRVQRALGAISLTVVGDHEGAVSRRATRGAIQAVLRDGPAILCLICHGKQTNDDTTLWLEDEQGNTAHVSGRAFGEMIAQLDRPPLLVTLIACDSGGALAALGPRLALAGVGAVVAMQAKLSLVAARTLLPALFADLATDGAVDRAVSVGRAALRTGDEWWVPALWLRVREGRLWADDASAPPAPAGISVAGNVGTVQVVTVSGGNVGSIIGSQHQYGVSLAAPVASGRAEAVARQRLLLAQHRETLATLLLQQATFGSAYAPPTVASGIREARAGIARAKAALVARGEAVEDMPDDTP